MNLSTYFSGVGAKRLRTVEVNPVKSNQHEFNGVAFLKGLLGSERRNFKGQFIYLSDEVEDTRNAEIFLTWYDSRENKEHRSPEYRLYYPSNSVITKCKPEDLLIIARTSPDDLMVIIIASGSTTEKQLLWLFGIDQVGDKFIVKNLSNERKDLGYAGRYILRQLGIEEEAKEKSYFEEILNRFGTNFPTTKEFSEFSRGTVKDISSVESPDETIIAWLEREEILFKHLEKEAVKKKLDEGFGDDDSRVENFIRFSLSVQNRRKSRAGFAFEHNLAVIFNENGINFSQGAVTESHNRPDFIFPGIEHYNNTSTNTSNLTMLGVKTTAKDRWRQVLSEAARIKSKHLITLEPAISRNQTEEMIAKDLQLVIPAPIIKTYKSDQQKSILSLRDFIDLVKVRQCSFQTSQLF